MIREEEKECLFFPPTGSKKRILKINSKRLEHCIGAPAAEGM
jgi:hypothetical protein